MNDYNSLRVDATPCNVDITDLAAAYLADAGFESFEPDESGLTAYIRATDGVEDIAREALSDFPIPTTFSFSSEYIEGEDWNEEWEKNYFQPILIDDQCVVHSTFHKDVPDAKYDIVIDPKMAFGTGHHDTTSQMMRLILKLPLLGKRVTDMGTGTGILAILSKMRGAESVTGIEIDEPAYRNALEHAELNKVELNLIHGDASALDGIPKADYLFANINRNIILEDMGRYVAGLDDEGEMLLSGFYHEDLLLIEEKGAEFGFGVKEVLSSETGWTAVWMSRKYMN